MSIILHSDGLLGKMTGTVYGEQVSKTPVQSAAELGKRGFKIVIFPGGTVRAVTHTLQGYYGSLQKHQTTAPWQSAIFDFDGLNDVIGTSALLTSGCKYQ